MGILEMDFERILGVPFFHSSSHSIMLWHTTTKIQQLQAREAAYNCMCSLKLAILIIDHLYRQIMVKTGDGECQLHKLSLGPTFIFRTLPVMFAKDVHLPMFLS